MALDRAGRALLLLGFIAAVAPRFGACDNSTAVTSSSNSSGTPAPGTQPLPTTASAPEGAGTTCGDEFVARGGCQALKEGNVSKAKALTPAGCDGGGGDASGLTPCQRMVAACDPYPSEAVSALKRDFSLVIAGAMLAVLRGPGMAAIMYCSSPGYAGGPRLACTTDAGKCTKGPCSCADPTKHLKQTTRVNEVACHACRRREQPVLGCQQGQTWLGFPGGIPKSLHNYTVSFPCHPGQDTCRTYVVDITAPATAAAAGSLVVYDCIASSDGGLTLPDTANPGMLKCNDKLIGRQLAKQWRNITSEPGSQSSVSFSSCKVCQKDDCNAPGTDPAPAGGDGPATGAATPAAAPIGRIDQLLPDECGCSEDGWVAGSATTPAGARPPPRVFTGAPGCFGTSLDPEAYYCFAKGSQRCHPEARSRYKPGTLLYPRHTVLSDGPITLLAPSAPKPEPTGPPDAAPCFLRGKAKGAGWEDLSNLRFNYPKQWANPYMQAAMTQHFLAEEWDAVGALNRTTCNCHVSCKTCVIDTPIPPGEKDVGAAGSCLTCADGSLPVPNPTGVQDGRGACRPQLTLRECTRDFTDYRANTTCDCAPDGVSNAVPTGREGCAHDSWGRFFCFTKGDCPLATRSAKYVSADGTRAAMFRPCSPPPNVLQVNQLRLKSPDCESEAARKCKISCTSCIPCLGSEHGSIAHDCAANDDDGGDDDDATMTNTRCNTCKAECEPYFKCPFIDAAAGVDRASSSRALSTRHSYCVMNESPRLIKGARVGLLDDDDDADNYKGTNPYSLVFGTRVDGPGFSDLDSAHLAQDTHVHTPAAQCSRPRTSPWGGMIDRLPFASAATKFTSPASEILYIESLARNVFAGDTGDTGDDGGSDNGGGGGGGDDNDPAALPRGGVDDKRMVLGLKRLLPFSWWWYQIASIAPASFPTRGGDMFPPSAFFEDDWSLAQWKLGLIVAKMADLPRVADENISTPEQARDIFSTKLLKHVGTVANTQSSSLTTCDALFYQATGFYQKKEQLRLAASRSVALFKRMACPNAPWAVNMSSNALCAFLRDSPRVFNYGCANDEDCPTITMPKICYQSCVDGWRYESQALPGEYFVVPGQETCYDPSVSDAETSTYSFDPLSVLLSDGIAGRALRSCTDAVQNSMVRIYESEDDAFCRTNLDPSTSFLISQCKDVDDCSGHGHCVGLNTCVCDPGFVGTTCDTDESYIVGCAGNIQPCGEDDKPEECDQAVIRLKHKERLAISSSAADGNGVRLANLVASIEPTYRRAGDPESVPKKYHEHEMGLFSLTVMNKTNYDLFENGLPYQSIRYVYTAGVNNTGADGLHSTVGSAIAAPGVGCINKSWTPADLDNAPLENDVVVVFACVAETLDCRIRYRLDFRPEPLPEEASAKVSRASLTYTPQQTGTAVSVMLKTVGNVDQFSSIPQFVSAPLASHTDDSDPSPDPSGCYHTKFSKASVSGKVVVLTAAGCHFWQAVLNAQQNNAAAVILDFHDGADTIAPLSGHTEQNILGCPPTQPDSASAHYNPAAWDDADSSCSAAVREGAIGGNESLSSPESTRHCQPGTPCTRAQLYMYSACCYAFADESSDPLAYKLDPEKIDPTIRKIADGSSEQLHDVVDFWKTTCKALQDRGAQGGWLALGMTGRFGLGFGNVCSKIALDPRDPFRKRKESRGASIFGYVSTVVGNTPTDEFPGNNSNSHRFWTARRSVKIKAKAAPGATYQPSYTTTPALRVPACNDVDVVRGVYRGLLKFDQTNDVTDITFAQINSLFSTIANESAADRGSKDPADWDVADWADDWLTQFFPSGFRVPRQGSNRYMCSIYSRVMWERKGRARSLQEMYGFTRIPVYKSVDGMVGRMIRQHRQSKGGGTGAQVVEIDAQPQSQAIRKDRLRLPGPWRIRFGSSDGSLPAKYAGYYYKQPSDSFGGCNDSETISTQAYQKKFFPRAVYVQIAGVAPQSYMYSINDKDLNVSHCTDNPNYQDPLKLTEHPGCAKILRGSTANRAFCRLRHVRDSFLWDSKLTQKERDSVDLFKQCPISCGDQECIGKKFWVIADRMCGHRDSATGHWRTFYYNPVIASADPSSPTRRRGSKGNDIIEKITDSWIKCGPDPSDPTKKQCAVATAVTMAENRSFFVRDSPKAPDTFGMRTQSYQNCKRMPQEAYEAANGDEEFDGNQLRGFARLPGAAPGQGLVGSRRTNRYFDLCGIFGSLVVDSAAPKVRFRVSLGPTKVPCSGVDSVVCAHPRLRDLPQQFSGIFDAAPEIAKTLKRKLVSSVTKLKGGGGSDWVNKMLRKFDSAVKIVLPLGGGVAREVLWDQSLSSGKSESLGHGYGNLTLNFLPAGVSVGANLTPSEVELRQQHLSQLMGLAGGSQKYFNVIRTSLLQAQQLIDSLPRLQTMLRDTNVDMGEFTKLISKLNPNAGDKSTRILKALKASSISNDTLSTFGRMKRAVAETGARAGKSAKKATGVLKFKELERLKDPVKLLPSLISKLPLEDNTTSFAAWSKSATMTLQSEGHLGQGLFNKLIDGALSIVPMRTQVTCVCDPDEHGELKQISAEGVLDEQDPQRVWIDSADNTAVVYGFTIRHLVCCDAAQVAADEAFAAVAAQFVASEDLSAVHKYDDAKGSCFVFLVVTSLLAVLGIVLAERDEAGWHLPTPVNFLIGRSNTRAVAFTVGAVSVFMFDFIFGLLFPSLFDSDIRLPLPTSPNPYVNKLALLVKFFWCIVMSLLLTPLSSTLQSKNKMAGAVVGMLLALAYTGMYTALLVLGSPVSDFQGAKWASAWLCSIISTLILGHYVVTQIRKSRQTISKPTKYSEEMVVVADDDGGGTTRATVHTRAASISMRTWLKHVNLIFAKADPAPSSLITTALKPPWWQRPFFMIWDSSSAKILTHRDPEFVAPPKLLAVMVFTTCLLVVLLSFWCDRAHIFTNSLLRHLNGENCASDPHELVFTEDGPGPTLMGVVQIPLITGEALDLSCEDNILVCDITLPVLIMSGVIVFLLNIIQLVRLPATVKVLLHRLHKGDRSFMPTTVAASMHTNKEFGLVYAVKFGGWQTAYSVSAFTITSTVLSLVLIMISIILAVPASRDVILDKVSADWAGWAYILAIGQVVWLAQEFLINLSRARRFDRGGVSALAVRWHFLYALVDFSGMFYNLMTGLVAFAARIAMAIVLFLVYLSRLDKCFALSGHENLDNAYKSFLGFLQVEAYYANPTLRVFIHLLQHRRRGIVSRARTRWLLAYTLLNNPLLRVWRRREKQECLRDSADATDSDSNSENSEAQSGGCCGKQQASTPVRFKASRESEILAQLAFHEQQIRKLHRELAASSAAPTAFSQQLGSAHESTGEDQAAHAGNATPGYLDVTSTLNVPQMDGDEADYGPVCSSFRQASEMVHALDSTELQALVAKSKVLPSWPPWLYVPQLTRSASEILLNNARFGPGTFLVRMKNEQEFVIVMRDSDGSITHHLIEINQEGAILLNTVVLQGVDTLEGVIRVLSEENEYLSIRLTHPILSTSLSVPNSHSAEHGNGESTI